MIGTKFEIEAGCIMNPKGARVNCISKNRHSDADSLTAKSTKKLLTQSLNSPRNTELLQLDDNTQSHNYSDPRENASTT